MMGKYQQVIRGAAYAAGAAGIGFVFFKATGDDMRRERDCYQRGMKPVIGSVPGAGPFVTGCEAIVTAVREVSHATAVDASHTSCP